MLLAIVLYKTIAIDYIVYFKTLICNDNRV